MRHEACVICGGWAVFLTTFALTALVTPVRSVFVPSLLSVASVLLATPVIHTGLRAREAASAN
ncbi:MULTISPECIES: hypothetical protein [unclassified Halobacterium]|uniref:hypothetical protein n=1 Tax=unclassified Halobacterium TaxID=2668073 RepID=UPI001E2A1D8C|nr:MULTISPECIES: hypothetical protein [unclassified Halobacterium]MCD2198588.1 hypothetical protein [Halobacterium sp. KA-4]MCD2201938.1 hypothetical protein [Halobacterium sp. KA-6]